MKVILINRGAGVMKYCKNPHALIFVFLFVISLLITPVLGVIPVQAATLEPETQSAIRDAIAYLQTELNDDGGVRWFDESSSVSASVRAVLALAAAGYPQDHLISQSGNRPIDFLAQSGVDWVFQRESDAPAFNIARAGQLLTAVATANQDPFKFGPESVNLVHLISSHYDPNTGAFGNATPGNVTDQVWAMLGLASAYATVPQDAVLWLVNAQLEDGSWDDGYGSYLDTTPLGLMALAASGIITESDPEVLLAVDFIQSQQSSTGGWLTAWDATTNANTTGMILQGLYAAGQNPGDDTWMQADGSPLTALLDLQQENGAIGGDFTNAFSTADAILGLSGQPLYDLGHTRRVGRAFEYIYAAQNPDGGWGSVGQTLDVILAARAAGWDPESISQNGNSPLDFVASDLTAYLEAGPDAIGKTILGAVAANQDPASFQGVDLVSSLMETYSPQTSAFGTPENTWHQSLAILGLNAAGATIPEDVVQTLVDLQSPDGGWEYSPGFGTWPDNTALALQALTAAGISQDDNAVQNGWDYIQSLQQDNGGWGDSSSGAFVLMAMNAAGINPTDMLAESGQNPADNLFSFQKPTGAFMYSQDFSDENLMSTTTAALAAVGGSFLINPPEQEPTPAAGLVVQNDLGEVTTACVALDRDTISGLALLNDSGMPYGSQDGFMNSILGVSNPQGGTMYWSYWLWNGREWAFNNVGAMDSVVLSGSIEAWFFTSWEVFPSPPPDFVPNINAICELNVLKRYAAQPFLSFYDLNPYPEDLAQVTSFTASEAVNEPAGDTETEVGPALEGAATPTVETQSETAEEAIITTPAETEERLPLTPILIIGVIGLALVVIIVWVLSRKK
jgi:prenyltransferase beta subunit